MKEKHGSFTTDKEFAHIPVCTRSWMPFPRIFNLSHTYMYIQYIHPTLCHTMSLINNAQVIVTFNFIQAHSYLHKKYIPKSWKLLNGDRVLVSIAWGCLAIILHGIRHSLFQLLKIRAHEKWQRGRKNPSPFSVLWYLNYEIRNYTMRRNRWNLLWNSGGRTASLWSCSDSGNSNDPRRIFLTPFAQIRCELHLSYKNVCKARSQTSMQRYSWKNTRQGNCCDNSQFSK